MKQALILGPKKIGFEEQREIELAPNEVQLEVDLVGVCATDVHIFDGDFPKATFPLVFGHEFTGFVVKVGSAVSSLAIGDRVAVDPAIPCMECIQCQRQRRNLCLYRKAYGINLPGGMATFANVRAENCHRFESHVQARAAVLTEPLACVVHAFERLGSVAGLDVLVLGAGAIGLLSLQVAKLGGADHVSHVDLDLARCEVAKQLGADAVAASISDLEKDKWDVVVDATGAVPAIREGLSVIERGGSFLQIGVSDPHAKVEVSPYEIFARELKIVGSLTTEGNFSEAVRLIASGQVETDLIVGEPQALEAVGELLSTPKKARSPKMVVSPKENLTER